MAIADSLTVKQGGTVAYTGSADVSYTKLETGRWTNPNATFDEPQTLTIKSNVRTSGQTSDYLVRLDQFKNPASGAPFGTSDSQLSVYVVIRCDNGTFTQAEVIAQAQRLGSLLCGAGMSGITLAQILRGER